MMSLEVEWRRSQGISRSVISMNRVQVFTHVSIVKRFTLIGRRAGWCKTTGTVGDRADLYFFLFVYKKYYAYLSIINKYEAYGNGY